MYKNLDVDWWRETIRYYWLHIAERDAISPIIAKDNRFDKVTAWW